MTVKRRPGRWHSESRLCWGWGVLPGECLSRMLSPHPSLPFPKGHLLSQPRGLGPHQQVNPFRENSPLELSLSRLARHTLTLAGGLTLPAPQGPCPGLPAPHPLASQVPPSRWNSPHMPRPFSPPGPGPRWSLFLECLIIPRRALLPSHPLLLRQEGPPLGASIAPCFSS